MGIHPFSDTPSWRFYDHITIVTQLMGCWQPMILRPGSPTVASTVPVEPETACSKKQTEKRAGMAARSAGCLASHGFRITQIRNCWIMIDKDLWENICCAEPIIIFSWPTHGYLVREQLFLLQHHVQASQFSHAEIRRFRKGIAWDSVCCGQRVFCYVPSICQTLRPDTCRLSPLLKQKNAQTGDCEVSLWRRPSNFKRESTGKIWKNAFPTPSFISTLFLMPMRCQQEKS